jgi:hypothetical protein
MKIGRGVGINVTTADALSNLSLKMQNKLIKPLISKKANYVSVSADVANVIPLQSLSVV